MCAVYAGLLVPTPKLLKTYTLERSLALPTTSNASVGLLLAILRRLSAYKLFDIFTFPTTFSLSDGLFVATPTLPVYCRYRYGFTHDVLLPNAILLASITMSYTVPLDLSAL